MTLTTLGEDIFMALMTLVKVLWQPLLQLVTTLWQPLMTTLMILVTTVMTDIWSIWWHEDSLWNMHDIWQRHDEWFIKQVKDQHNKLYWGQKSHCSWQYAINSVDSVISWGHHASASGQLKHHVARNKWTHIEQQENKSCGYLIFLRHRQSRTRLSHHEVLPDRQGDGRILYQATGQW